MHNTPITVLLASDDRLLRESLLRLFEGEKDVMVVGQAGNCTEAAQQMSKVRTDVLLLNPASRALSELDDLQHTHQVVQQPKIVLFGMEEHDKLFLEAVRHGAVGYVLKDACAHEIIGAVRAVAGGGAACPPRLCLLLLNCVARQGITLMPALRLHIELGLTRRERELLPMIARGLTNKEIASQLNVSEQTIKNHVHRMIRKAGARTRLDIVERCRIPELVL